MIILKFGSTFLWYDFVGVWALHCTWAVHWHPRLVNSSESSFKISYEYGRLVTGEEQHIQLRKQSTPPASWPSGGKVNGANISWGVYLFLCGSSNAIVYLWTLFCCLQSACYVPSGARGAWTRCHWSEAPFLSQQLNNKVSIICTVLTRTWIAATFVSLSRVARCQHCWHSHQRTWTSQ